MADHRAKSACSTRSPTPRRQWPAVVAPSSSTYWPRGSGRWREAAARHVERLDELARAYLGDRAELGTITRDELRRRLHDGDVVVLDVRLKAEYDAGHIRGALSVPVADLKARLREIPDGADIVAYCRGPFCVYADEAVRVLAAKGRAAVRLEDGFPEWQADRLPVERSET